MAGHLNHEHAGSFEQRQLMIMLEMSERPMDDAAPAECPLCPAQDSLGRLLGHLAQHLEEISLFALPLKNDTVDGDADHASNAAIGTEGQSRKLSQTWSDPSDEKGSANYDEYQLCRLASCERLAAYTIAENGTKIRSLFCKSRKSGRVDHVGYYNSFHTFFHRI
jgi:hypothetical protein